MEVEKMGKALAFDDEGKGIHAPGQGILSTPPRGESRKTSS
jgi:hypothetical protein